MELNRNFKRHVLPEGWKPRCFLLDVDGVLTTGQFFYSKEGKVYKVFGPDDHDALLLLQSHVKIRFITGDRKGLEITRKRIVEDMHMALDLVSTIKRAEWIEQNLPIDQTIYMGDGIFDASVFERVPYSIAPADAFPATKTKASFVTTQGGGNRAVAEACFHILEKFFPQVCIDYRLSAGQGEWGV